MSSSFPLKVRFSFPFIHLFYDQQQNTQHLPRIIYGFYFIVLNFKVALGVSPVVFFS